MHADNLGPPTHSPASLQDEIKKQHVPISLATRLVTLIGISLPLIGVAFAIVIAWGRGVYWTDLGLLLGLYVVTVLGVTVGFHRLFVHRSFETYTWMKFIWAVLGSIAVQGSVFHWVAKHRLHHQFADKDGDPHSPHTQGTGVLGMLKGIWHAHVGWMMSRETMDVTHYVKDLVAVRSLRIADRLFPVWVALSLLIPGIIGGAINRSWEGFATGMLWGGLVRIFLVHHVTWSINSACHLWGSQTYSSNDESRDNLLFGILAFGEGWHNTHHTFPTSARHGLRWWQLDLSYALIRLLAWLRLAWNVKLPSKEAQAARSMVPN